MAHQVRAKLSGNGVQPYARTCAARRGRPQHSLTRALATRIMAGRVSEKAHVSERNVLWHWYKYLAAGRAHLVSNKEGALNRLIGVSVVSTVVLYMALSAGNVNDIMPRVAKVRRPLRV